MILIAPKSMDTGWAGLGRVRSTYLSRRCRARAAYWASFSARKRRNLKLAPDAAVLNFGGEADELWCEGGEVGFIERMIAESATRPQLCFWFTTLVSKSANLPRLRRALARVDASHVLTIDMAQGQKQSRILAWTFMQA